MEEKEIKGVVKGRYAQIAKQDRGVKESFPSQAVRGRGLPLTSNHSPRRCQIQVRDNIY